MALTREYPEVDPSICFTSEGYKGTADFNNIYLGWDNTLAIYPKVTLEAIFENRQAAIGFMDWWKNETERGSDIFLIQSTVYY